MRTVSITLDYNVVKARNGRMVTNKNKVTDGYTQVSLDYIQENGLENEAMEVIDDDPESLSIKLFGHPREPSYYIKTETYDRIFNAMYPPEPELSD